jgi:natural product biosynthesis luciferase-like monooxygenase protein
MRFGLNFFPSVDPRRLSGHAYYQQALALAARADELGYHHIRTVEHYFRGYGGYSPSPIVFLTAVAQRTRRARLVTGAVLPAFNHPIKLAAELAMLDCLSDGRLDAGFARAFLPEEFDAFQVPMDESRARFEEGITAVKRLWTEPEVRFEGLFHQFGPLPLLPRPVQQPHPPIWVAAIQTAESFVWAGEQGYNLMIVPYLSAFDSVATNLRAYRESCERAGHSAGGRQVQMSFHLYVAEDGVTARREAQAPMEEYIRLFRQSATAWIGRTSGQYKGYERLVNILDAITYERVLAESRALIGDPVEVAAQMRMLIAQFGPVEPSLQVMFGDIPEAAARRSLELFAAEVMPRLTDLSSGPAPWGS